ncbi:MAG: histidine kinase [Hydrocarboniphaga sp.]|uniref:PAS-domain containing protein n=1 Tax=Hydrocarboniphaga sp. TaxID=2033016 RepID=UPI002637A82D|nr:PAS-domain containing protein [Hydrocarboniphaga sp.]MDB5972670.1 histidine kinase [Hydrocarboniphaga sp.]
MTEPVARGLRRGSHPLRLAVTIAALLGVIGAVMLGVGRQATRQALRDAGARSLEQLALYAGSLQSQIDRYRVLPAVLALDPELRAALRAPVDAAASERLSRKLEAVNGVAETSTLTLLDRRGLGVAANNWRSANSNVGVDYRFRPYFQQAMRQGTGRFYGIGITTGVPGYFLAQAVHDDDGSTIGAVTVKLDLRRLEQEWASATDIVLISDAHGIVFLSNRLAWRYRELRALSAADRDELGRTQQYAGQTLQILQQRDLESLAACRAWEIVARVWPAVSKLRAPEENSESYLTRAPAAWTQRAEAAVDLAKPDRLLGTDGRRVRILSRDITGDYLWQSLPLASAGWTLHLLHDTRDTLEAGRVAALAAAGAALSLLFLLLLLQQRLRLSKLRRRSRDELEQMVRQHAEAMRSAEDGIVLAAERASVGQRQSLEHLPQGVGVIDAELRLSAWNRRYVDIFRYPPELMKIGRPIEDLLRYNARRGLLGSGDIEEAVQRRLDHLRTGKPHMFEREWADGTVLEIRGNPLPGGGFVTSYADITAYKNTARDLRTLAGSLEKRVDERTQDLDAARREAERANKSKSSFVAAAVHDLLQPLNAARMYTSALRERLRNADDAQLADNVDEALAAQDDILASLLDISRLESGAIRTEIRDLSLQRMFDALLREFAPMAESRGLQLRQARTRAAIRSDEALLRRILQNFLSNALRYTDRGGVLIGARRVSNDSVRIEVWDSGCGIAEHQQTLIFEEFQRLDGGARRHDRGAGLGLAIVQRIAQRLAHRITLRSRVGRGSMFAVEVPRGDAAKVQPASRASAEPGSALQNRRIWCIDDDARVREATRTLLEAWGCAVTLAGSMEEALVLAASRPPPELVLLDYRLGAGTGAELMPKLFERWRQRPPVIVISAERETASQAASENGWGFLPKPVKPAALRALMRQLLLVKTGVDSR